MEKDANGGDWWVRARGAVRQAWGWAGRERPVVKAAMAPAQPDQAEQTEANHGKASEKKERQPRFLGDGGLRNMGEFTQAQARKIKSQQAEGIARAALAEGKWVAASDASVEGGRAAIAWGIFNPQGELAASGSERLQSEGHVSIKQAEFEALLRVAGELDALGAPSALCLSDSLESVWDINRAGCAKARAWEEVSKGRFDTGWVPREAMGPANDAARAALGLRPEKGVDRQWAHWLDDLALGGGAMAKGWDALSAPAQEAFASAREKGEWIALTDARLGEKGGLAQAGVAIFDGEGELRGMFTQAWPLERSGDLAGASKLALGLAAQKLNDLCPGKALCLCAALEEGAFPEGGRISFVKAAPSAMGPVGALASRARNQTEASSGGAADLAGHFNRWMLEMENSCGLFGAQTKEGRQSRIASRKKAKISKWKTARSESPTGSPLAASGAEGANQSAAEKEASIREGTWVAVWARALDKRRPGKAGVAAALFDAEGRFMQEVSSPVRFGEERGEDEAIASWLTSRVRDWGAVAWEGIEARADGGERAEDALAGLGPKAQLQLGLTIDGVVKTAPMGQAEWQAWMDQARSDARQGLSGATQADETVEQSSMVGGGVEAIKSVESVESVESVGTAKAMASSESKPSEDLGVKAEQNGAQWRVAWGLVAGQTANKVGVAGAIFNAEGRMVQEVEGPVKWAGGEAERAQAVEKWLDARVKAWGEAAWESVEVSADGAGREREAWGSLARAASRHAGGKGAAEDWAAGARLDASGWQAWMAQRQAPAPEESETTGANEKTDAVAAERVEEPVSGALKRGRGAVKPTRAKPEWLAAWEAESLQHAELPPIVVNLSRRREQEAIEKGLIQAPEREMKP